MSLVDCICIWAPCALVTARDPFEPQGTKGKDHRPSLLFNHSPLLAQSVQCQYHKRRIEANQFYGALEKSALYFFRLIYSICRRSHFCISFNVLAKSAREEHLESEAGNNFTVRNNTAGVEHQHRWQWCDCFLAFTIFVIYHLLSVYSKFSTNI